MASVSSFISFFVIVTFMVLIVGMNINHSSFIKLLYASVYKTGYDAPHIIVLTESTFYYSIHSGEDIYDSHSVVKFILKIETIKCL